MISNKREMGKECISQRSRERRRSKGGFRFCAAGFLLSAGLGTLSKLSACLLEGIM